MSRHHPQTLIKSRSTMLELSNDGSQPHKYKIFDRAREAIWIDMEQNVFGKGKTKYIVSGTVRKQIYMGYCNMSLFQNGLYFEPFLQNEFIEFLKKDFPGCSIEYVETNGDIIIDWS